MGAGPTVSEQNVKEFCSLTGSCAGTLRSRLFLAGPLGSTPGAFLNIGHHSRWSLRESRRLKLIKFLGIVRSDGIGQRGEE
jgi:hypothetical protein